MTEPVPPDAAAPPRRRLLALASAVAAVVAVAVALFAAGHLTAHRHGGNSRPVSMQHSAAQVMPFDLNATTHTFSKTNSGGVEQVIVNSPSDRANIDLIRGHLRQETTKFTKGDFTDSAAIHGTGMPGLKKLQEATGRLHVTYAEVAGGARITYTSPDREVIAAIHSWFDAQTHDHAMPGMGG
jgi:hypothetical protein